MPRIIALIAEVKPLSHRVANLEEELALAKLHRFAPRGEKHIDRLFNEAEKAADDDDSDYGKPELKMAGGRSRHADIALSGSATQELIAPQPIKQMDLYADIRANLFLIPVEVIPGS